MAIQRALYARVPKSKAQRLSEKKAFQKVKGDLVLPSAGLVGDDYERGVAQQKFKYVKASKNSKKQLYRYSFGGYKKVSKGTLKSRAVRSKVRRTKFKSAKRKAKSIFHF